MRKRFSEFRFQHPVPLFEFCEMRRCCHSRVSLGVRSSDDSFVTCPSDQVDVTKPLLRPKGGIEIPRYDSFIHKKLMCG
jgi:hypothetical protein